MNFCIKIEAWDFRGSNEGVLIQYCNKNIKTLESAKHEARKIWPKHWAGYKKQLTIFDEKGNQMFKSKNW